MALRQERGGSDNRKGESASAYRALPDEERQPPGVAYGDSMRSVGVRAKGHVRTPLILRPQCRFSRWQGWLRFVWRERHLRSLRRELSSEWRLSAAHGKSANVRSWPLWRALHNGHYAQ